MSSAQVQDIQYQQSSMFYMVVNGELVAKQEPFDLYYDLFRIVGNIVETTTEIDIWLSKIPCPACINFLHLIIPSSINAVLHVESLQYNGSNFETLRDLGCLAKLSNEYDVKAWDWDVFSTRHDSCDYYATSKYNADYLQQKTYTKKLMTFLGGNFTKSPLTDLCDL